MITRLRLCLVFLLLAPGALAETVRVNSGEHDTFSRLVLRLAEPSNWKFGRVADGYELRLTRPGIVLDLQQVFLLIPRKRVTAAVSPADGKLQLAVAEGVHAIAFETQPGTIVLDVITGAPPAASQFEAVLDIEEPAALPPAPPVAAQSELPLLPRAAFAPSDPRLSSNWSGLAPADAAPLLPKPAPGALAAPVTDPRVLEAEQKLLMQLGRAASQGLVTMTLPETPPPAKPSAPSDPEVPLAQGAENVPTRPQDHLALRSETVFDRDSAADLPHDRLTPVGLTCLVDDAVNIAAWRSDAPAALQLGNARSGLVGEFDRPDPDRVLALARLYLALGMGTEVAALFDSLGTEPHEGGLLRAMAAVIDDLPVPAGSSLGDMTACDSPVALWALLANPSLGRGDPLSLEAVLRAFSGLPIELRRLLGPRLADRLLALGAASAARSVRDAIFRAPGEHGTAVGLIDAGIEVATGSPAAAASALAPILAENGPEAPLATVRYIDAILASGVRVDLPAIEAVAALAREHRGAPDGPALARAHILAAGSAGLFERAFDALAAMPDSATDEFVAAATTDLITQLAATPDDLIFATQYFRSRALVLLQRNWPLQVKTAERLLDLGFADEARRALGSEAVRHEEGRLLRARAAILGGDGSAALAEIAGLDGAQATRLRADALRLTGDHEAARRAYLLADAPDLAATEAWSAGDWVEAAQLGSAAQRELLAALDLGGSSISPAPAPTRTTPLAASRALLEQSRAARDALSRVLAEAARQ